MRKKAAKIVENKENELQLKFPLAAERRVEMQITLN